MSEENQQQRKSMSMDSSEVLVKGFAGLGTVTRHAGENLIIIGRDAEALKYFHKRWAPDFTPDEAKYKKTVLIAASQFIEA